MLLAIVRIARILIDEDAGGHSCLSILPKMCNDPELNTKAEVMQCTGLLNCQGRAMVRISDPNDNLSGFCNKTRIGSNEYGNYVMDRVSKNHYVAIVKNNYCEVAKLVHESDCFITSAVMQDDTPKGKPMVCWTIMGTDNKSFSELLEKLEKNDYGIYVEASYIAGADYNLTAKQEESVRLAFENGYYDIPKKVDVRELCAMAGISRSTYDVSLRTAEKKIIGKFLQAPVDDTKYS